MVATTLDRFGRIDIFLVNAGITEARASIGRYLGFYNSVSLHPSVYAVEVKRFC